MSTTEVLTCASPELRDPMLPQWYRVQQIRRETQDTFTLVLEAPEGNADFRFAPGQFNMLYAYGVGEVPISISGDPNRNDVIVHTIRAVGTVTRALWHLKLGDLVGMRGPFGSAWPLTQSRNRDLVIVAGGIGLAPLRPVVYHVLRNRDHFRRVVLLYGARSPRDQLYAQELLPPCSLPNIQVGCTVDRADNGWHGSIGVVTTLISDASFDPQNAIALLCGPEVMMRFSVRSLMARGITNDRIFVSLERNMKCAVGFCGHCQYGPTFLCKDGPVFRFDAIERLFGIREL